MVLILNVCLERCPPYALFAMVSCSLLILNIKAFLVLDMYAYVADAQYECCY